tara:strand:- start:1749 stop:1877 length:129 start_codon:yes stop_codon:yes gene_type:complete
MKDVKSFIIGFLVATMVFMLMGAGKHQLGSTPVNPVYVKVVK